MRMTISHGMGECFGLSHPGDDAAMGPHIDLAIVACGSHASPHASPNATDATTMRITVRPKSAYNPSMPDFQGFGRSEW